MNKMEETSRFILELYEWMSSRDFMGFDPYDGANSEFQILRYNKIIRLIMVYLNKFSPINFRPLLGINKRKTMHGLSLVNLSLSQNRMLYNEKLIQENIQYIISKSLFEKYGYHCWNGTDMYIQTLKEYQKPDQPGIFGTEACAQALIEFSKMRPQNKEILEILKSVKNFFIEKLFTTFKGHSFFRYKPITPVYQNYYNVSIKAAAYIAKLNVIINENSGNDKVKATIYEVISNQNSNGSWNYGINLITKKEKKQIDFHQGFILDGLMDYMEIFGKEDFVYNSFLKGLSFYENYQFNANGQGLYRYPRVWPANIQNQAQGLITFKRASKFLGEKLYILEKVFEWTIENMRDKNGYFYYLKYPFLNNKIPYMRWCQSSMLYALSNLIND